jgi:energy-converting hydrogenase Eha subunit A
MDDEPVDNPLPSRPAWRTMDFPWYVLAVGILIVAAAALGLASVGGWPGIAAVAVLLAAVVVLFGVWSEGPPVRRGPDHREPA